VLVDRNSPFLSDRNLRDFNTNAILPLHLRGKSSPKRPVRKHPRHPAKQLFTGSLDSPPPGSRAAIVDIGWANPGREQIAHGIYDEKSFSSFDELASINPDLMSASATVLNTLTINYCHTGNRAAPSFCADINHQTIIDPLPGSIAFPLAKVPVNGLPTREFAREITPNTPILGHVLDAIYNVFQGPAATTLYFYHFFDNLPRLGRKIATVLFYSHSAI
jgi:hypothetical protein